MFHHAPTRRPQVATFAAVLLTMCLVASGCDDEDELKPLDNTGFPLGIVPEHVELMPGATVDFDATGYDQGDVVWEVLGEEPNGTIDQDGVYDAPTDVPTPSTIVIRASVPGPFTASALAEAIIVESP
jgi:hypothetical protein